MGQVGRGVALGAAIAAVGTMGITTPALAVSLDVSNGSIVEGDTGTRDATVTVTPSCGLLEVSSTPVSFALAGREATASSDFASTATPSNATVTCTLGVASAPFAVKVTVKGDTLYEADETLDVVPSTGDPAGRVTITDDDSARRPVVSIGDASAAEGTGSTSATLKLPVTLSNPSGRTASVRYAVTAGSASAATDFVAVSGMLTFLAGETQHTIAVPVIGDALDEPDEMVTATLSSPVAAGLETSSAVGTIANDDVPSVRVAGARGAEGDTGQTTFRFGVTLSNPSVRALSVGYVTEDRSATAGVDYTAASGRLSFAPGETSSSFDVAVTPDAALESDEDFAVRLAEPDPASLVLADGGLALGTIVDDDAAAAVVPAADAPAATATIPPVVAAPAASSAGNGAFPVIKASAPLVAISKPVRSAARRLRVAVTCPREGMVCRGRLSVKVRGAKRALASAVYVVPSGGHAVYTCGCRRRMRGRSTSAAGPS